MADELASTGALAALYVRQGDDFVAVRASSGHSRRLNGASALVRTLSRHPATLVSGAPESDPVSQALLQELGTEAAMLIRDRDELVAIACLENLAEPSLRLDEQSAARIASLYAAGLRKVTPTPPNDGLFRTLVGTFFPHFR